MNEAEEAARRVSDAIKALQEHQRQLDMDGVWVGVPREALDVVLTSYLSLRASTVEECAKIAAHFGALHLTSAERNVGREIAAHIRSLAGKGAT